MHDDRPRSGRLAVSDVRARDPGPLRHRVLDGREAVRPVREPRLLAARRHDGLGREAGVPVPAKERAGSFDAADVDPHRGSAALRRGCRPELAVRRSVGRRELCEACRRRPKRGQERNRVAKAPSARRRERPRRGSPTRDVVVLFVREDGARGERPSGPVVEDVELREPEFRQRELRRAPGGGREEQEHLSACREDRRSGHPDGAVAVEPARKVEGERLPLGDRGSLQDLERPERRPGGDAFDGVDSGLAPQLGRNGACPDDDGGAPRELAVGKRQVGRRQERSPEHRKQQRCHGENLVLPEHGHEPPK